MTGFLLLAQQPSLIIMHPQDHRPLVLAPSSACLKCYLKHLKVFYIYLNTVWWRGLGLDSIVIWISLLRTPWDNDLGARSVFRMQPQRRTERRRGALYVRTESRWRASEQLAAVAACSGYHAAEASRVKPPPTVLADRVAAVWMGTGASASRGLGSQLESFKGWDVSTVDGTRWWMLAARWRLGCGSTEHLHLASSHGLDFLPAPQSQGSQTAYKVEQDPRTSIPENKAKQPQLF